MEELLKAYSETNYIVFNPKITIRIGQVNEALEQLLKNHDCNTWAFITGWNPYSELTNAVTNEANNIRLRKELINFKLFEGEGVGTDQSWQPEHSYLILGISFDEAMLMGKKYKQNAIVVGKINEAPELVWTR